MSEQVQIVELVENKHWRISNNLGETIEIEAVLPDGTRIVTDLAPDAVFHIIPKSGMKIDVIYRRYSDGPRLRLV